MRTNKRIRVLRPKSRILTVPLPFLFSVSGSVSVSASSQFPVPFPLYKVLPFPVLFPSYKVLPRMYEQPYTSRTTSKYKYIMPNRSEQLQMNS